MKRSTLISISLITLGVLIPPTHAVIVLCTDEINHEPAKSIYWLVLYLNLVAGAALCFMGAISWSIMRCKDAWDTLALCFLSAFLAVGLYMLDAFVCFVVGVIISFKLHGFEGIH